MSFLTHRWMALNIVGIILALAAASASSLTNAGAVQPTGSPSPSPATDPCARVQPADATLAAPRALASPVTDVPYDLLLLDLLIPHQERIADAARVGEARSDHSELAEFSVDLATSATARAERLTAWRDEWYRDVPAMSEPEIVVLINRLAEDNPGRGGLPGALEILALAGLVDDLCAADIPFDLAFMDAMIEALDAELLLARVSVDLATRDEARTAAEEIIAMDQPRLDALIAWRVLWYDGTPVHEHG